MSGVSSASQPIGVIARLLDLSERRVQQLSREGVIPKAERGAPVLSGTYQRLDGDPINLARLRGRVVLG